MVAAELVGVCEDLGDREVIAGGGVYGDGGGTGGGDYGLGGRREGEDVGRMRVFDAVQSKVLLRLEGVSGARPVGSVALVD